MIVKKDTENPPPAGTEVEKVREVERPEAVSRRAAMGLQEGLPGEAQPLTEREVRERGFTSSVPWEEKGADCLVLACSDQRFRVHIQDFVRNLGYESPYIISIPSGVVSSLPLLTVLKFLPNFIDKLVQGVILRKGVKEIICIAHEGCGPYVGDGGNLVNITARRFTGKDVRQIQIEHLRKATRRLRQPLRGVRVRAFFADVVEEDRARRVKFEHIEL